MQKGKSKSKGGVFERDIAKTLEKWWLYPNLTLDEFKLIWKTKRYFWRSVGSGAQWEPGDISVDQTIWFPFIIECKAYKSLDFLQLLTSNKNTKIRKWWEQVTKDQEKARMAGNYFNRLLIIKINNFPILIVFSKSEISFKNKKIRYFELYNNFKESLIICLFSDFQEVFTKDKLEIMLKKDLKL